MLGLPDHVRACLFDLDGVLTDTASVHTKAWKAMFDAYLSQRAERTGEKFVPFDPAKQTPVQCPTGASAATCTAMGANYQLAANFGTPLNNLAYQTPRTVRVSLGLRF